MHKTCGYVRAVGSAGGEDDTVGAGGLVIRGGGGVDGSTGHDGKLRGRKPAVSSR